MLFLQKLRFYETLKIFVQIISCLECLFFVFFTLGCSSFYFHYIHKIFFLIIIQNKKCSIKYSIKVSDNSTKPPNTSAPHYQNKSRKKNQPTRNRLGRKPMLTMMLTIGLFWRGIWKGLLRGFIERKLVRSTSLCTLRGALVVWNSDIWFGVC